MLTQLKLYFAAEKLEALLFLCIAALAVAIALWLWGSGHRLRSAVYPLVAVGLIQLVVGTTVYFRTSQQVATLSAELESNPAVFKQTETARMAIVMKKFNTYKILEIFLLALGVCLILLMRRSDMALGIGVGLVLQSSLMLGLDLFAEIRGEDYLIALQKL
jgi:drug/metabolite transporter (DMT)-like permease